MDCNVPHRLEDAWLNNASTGNRRCLPAEKDTLTGGDILPGFKLPLKEWFGELDRLAGRK